MKYLDFTLEIGMGRGRAYPVFVIGSPAGEAHEFMKFPFDGRGLESQLLALQTALLRSGSKQRKILSPEEKTVQNFGQALFDALFIGEVRSCYDVSQREAFHQDKGLRIKLCLQSPELASLPWEFLYDKRKAEYICFSSTTPIVRYLELSQPPQPLAVTLPLSILGMIANPKDLSELDVEREKYRVEKSLEKLLNTGLVKLTWLSDRTWQGLQRAMRSDSWHIFHYIGHGGFDTLADEGLIALEDEEGYASNLTATDLGRLLTDSRSLRLIVLNSCDSAKGSKNDIFSSTAAILVRCGLPAVLAMQYEITDTAAIQLSRTFYEALADGLPVDTAVAEARKAISIAIKHTLEWGTPVLFMRSPDGVLFNLPQVSIRSRNNEPIYERPSVEEQISLWIQAASKREETKKTYEKTINSFRNVLQQKSLDLNSEEVPIISSLLQEWAGRAEIRSSIKPNTYNNRIFIIRSFYKEALKQHWITSNPAAMVESREIGTSNSVKPLELEEVRSALKSIPRFTPLGKRNYALLCLLLTTGLHLSEVIELRCGAIIREKNTMTITFKLNRSSEVSLVPIYPGTAKSLNEYISAVYPDNFAVDSPLWLSFSPQNKGKPIGKETVRAICSEYLGTKKVEATRATYEMIKEVYGIKGIENIENLLGIDVVSSNN